MATSTAKILGLFQNFYQDLFCSLDPTGISECLNALRLKVTEDMNVKLAKDYVPEEVRAIFFQMNHMSSPGLDGFNVGFY